MIHKLFFYLTILLLPTQLAYHMWPDWTIVLGRHIDYLAPAIHLTDLCILATIVSHVVSTKRFPIVPKQIIVLLGVLAIVNTMISTHKLLATLGWLKILELTLFFFYVRETSPSHRRVFALLSASLAFSCALGIAQSLHGRSIGGLLWFIGERTFTINTPAIAKQLLCVPSGSCIEFLRPYATLPHPNVFAGFLGFYILIALRYNALVFTILPLITLLLTTSRSAWIALGVSALLQHILRQKTKNILFAPIIGLFVALSLLLPFIPISTTNNESIDVRVALNNSAMSMIQSNFITGLGIDHFLVSLPAVFPHRDIYFLQPVHNVYLLFLAEIGLIGAIVLFVIIFRARISAQALPFAIFLLLVGMFDHYLLTTQQGNLLLTLGALYSTIPSWFSPKQG